MKVLELYNKEEAKNLKVGFSVLLVILVAFFAVLFSRDEITHKGGGSYYQIYARFNRTDGLMVGDAVRLAGMDIGRVVGARLDGDFKAIMTLEINDKIQLPDDSSAAIVSSAVMGAKYIEIEPGGSEDMIAPGGEFSYTQDAMIIEELIERIIGIGKAKRQSKKETLNNGKD